MGSLAAGIVFLVWGFATTVYWWRRQGTENSAPGVKSTMLRVAGPAAIVLGVLLMVSGSLGR